MYHGIVLLLEPDHTLRSHLMECCYAWHWAVYTIDDVASALHALSHPSVRWCLLNVADHPPRADTLAHLHAALRSDQRVILAVAGDQVGSVLGTVLSADGLGGSPLYPYRPGTYDPTARMAADRSG